MLHYLLCPLCTHSQAAAKPSPYDVVCWAAGVPITFDFHHHRFCKGGLTEEQAFKAAIATWPKGVRPQVTPFLDICPYSVLKPVPFPPFTFDPSIVNAMCKDSASDCHVSVGLHVVQPIPSLDGCEGQSTRVTVIVGAAAVHGSLREAVCLGM